MCRYFNAGECAIIRTRKYTCSESQPVTRDALPRRDCSATPGTFSPCIFEYVYFARPDSVIDGVSVYKSRLAMGEALARKIASDHELLDAIDVIIPVCAAKMCRCNVLGGGGGRGGFMS